MMAVGAEISGTRDNGLSHGRTSVCADDLCTVVGNAVSARNPFVVHAQVVTVAITSVTLVDDVAEKNDFTFFTLLIFGLNPTRWCSAVQTALVGCSSVDNWAMSSCRAEGRVEFCLRRH